MKLAKRVESIEPSATLSINARAKELIASGVDVINFGVGEPDFPTPDHVKEAAIQAIRDNFTRYTPVGGIAELKEAIISQFERDYGLSYQPAEILVSCGGKHAIYNVAQALLDERDEVIIPSPYWVSYPDIVRLAGGRPIIVPTNEEMGFKISPEKLEEAITPRCKLFILNSPSNPTGSVYTKEELEALAEVILKHKLVVLSDDIYNKIVFDDMSWHSIVQIDPSLKEQVIILNGVSKTYCMTGWRIGFIAGKASLISACTKIQSQSTSNPNSIAQKASIAALNGPQDEIDKMLEAFKERRDYFITHFKNNKSVTLYPPEGAFYIFPNFSSYYGKRFNGKPISDSIDMATFLMEEALLALVPGSAFGEDCCLRFSFATSMESIKKGLNQLEKALQELC